MGKTQRGNRPPEYPLAMRLLKILAEKIGLMCNHQMTQDTRFGMRETWKNEAGDIIGTINCRSSCLKCDYQKGLVVVLESRGFGKGGSYPSFK